MTSLRITPAQYSALERRAGGGLDPLTLAAWQGSRLVFAPGDAEGLWGEMNDASNAEDAHAEQCSDAMAGRAARSLAALAGRILLTTNNVK